MELVRFPSSRGFSVRSILTFAFAVITSAILLTPLFNTPASAAPTAEWSGEAIIYNTHAFMSTGEVNDSSKTIPEGAKVYKTKIQNAKDKDTKNDKIMVLFFAPGVDPPTATTATYVEFNVENGDLLNPSAKSEISLKTQEDSDSGSSCDVTGIGWIICPVSTFIADSMDTLFDLLANKLLATQPIIINDTGSSLYVAWNIMRGIANALFVIGFLVIIYSQLTGFGVSNYGIKRVLPRLIVAAVLVNISFYISALAVDVSNILGFSMQEMFNGIRENVFHLTNDDLSGFNTNAWGSVVSVALAGGGVIGGSFFMAGGGYHYIVPVLVAAALTIAFVVVILAARQAIIIILIIISPLAFVAYLLPNTEKLFDKWKDLFMTMLIFFPAMSVVFGGSQLAGQLIIQNSDGDFFILLFGLAVQVAALAITPMILKFSGGLLGRIAQIANDPKRGVLDRSKNNARERAELTRQRNIALGPRKRNPTTWGAGMVRAADFRKRNRKGQTEAWAQEASNRYEQTKGAHKVHEMSASANLDKERIAADNEKRIETLKGMKSSRLHDKTIDSIAAKEGLQTAQQDLAGYHNTMRTVGGTKLNDSQTTLEASKRYSEASQKSNEAYINEQSTFRFSKLGQAAERLEAAKIHADGWQSQYTASMDALKVDPNSTLGKATVNAQVQKDGAEIAQANVQAMLNKDRVKTGSALNMSTLELEAAKDRSAEAQSILTTYTNSQRSEEGGVLHVQRMRTENAKLKEQVSTGTLSRTVEEYKTGTLERTGELKTIMDEMVEGTALVTAEAQGASAAGNVQKKNIAEAFTTESHPLNETLLRTAASVDPYGRIRAEASAVSTLNEASSKVRTLNQGLLEERALGNHMTPVQYAASIIEGVFNGTSTESPDAIDAAMEILSKDAQIPLIRRMRSASDLFDQTALSAAILRNEGTLKSKGGFDIAADPSLEGASQERMNSSTAFTLGNIAPADLPGMKFAAIKDYAERFNKIIEDAKNEPDAGKRSMALSGLASTYRNIRLALDDPETLSHFSAGNLRFTAEMFAKLHQELGDGSDLNIELERLIGEVPPDILEDK